MKPNVPHLRQTMAHIEAHPEQWDQGSWVNVDAPCGTAYCFAGWAAVLGGAGFAKDVASNNFRSCVIPRGGTQPVDVAEFAADLLGVERYEVDRTPEDGYEHLFCSTNDLDDLRRIVDELCAETEVTP